MAEEKVIPQLELDLFPKVVYNIKYKYMINETINLKEEVWKLITKFYKEYNQVPGTGFLAGYFKVSIESIRLILIRLEDEKKIKRIKQEKNRTNYKLIQ